MSRVILNGHEYDIRLFVFDKDGLMFESKRFWIELAQARTEAVRQRYPHIPTEVVKDWLTFVGVSCQKENDHLEVTNVSPTGILAVAPVPEEVISSAAFFSEHLGMDWPSSRKMAEEIFAAGDELFDLRASLKPKKGFPEILRRLREAEIPYGVATSDTKERVQQSMDLYDRFEDLKFTVTLDDVEKGKPNPDMLLWIQQKMGIPMEHIAMVGDSDVDVIMARAAGAIGIGIPEHEHMKERMTGAACEILESLEDIILIR